MPLIQEFHCSTEAVGKVSIHMGASPPGYSHLGEHTPDQAGLIVRPTPHLGGLIIASRHLLQESPLRYALRYRHPPGAQPLIYHSKSLQGQKDAILKL